MNKYNLPKTPTLLVGVTPSNTHPERVGLKKDQFSAKNKTQRYSQLGKKLFKDSVENYLKKENVRLFVFYEKNNYRGLVKAGNLIYYENEIKVILNIIKNEFFLVNENGKEKTISCNTIKKKFEPELITIDRTTLENFL